MRYCGIVVGERFHHMCTLEEVREAEPPVRLHALFYEPGTTEAVAAELRALEDVVVAIDAGVRPPAPGRAERLCDEELRRMGVVAKPCTEPAQRLGQELSELGLFVPEADAYEGLVAEGAFREAAVFETNADGVFCALQGRRVPARRHPLGIERRIEELVDDHVVDEGGDLWHRRIEEIEAAAGALAAHRYAVGHAFWVGDPDEGVVVLPGSPPEDGFTADGVLPPVERVPLAGAAS